MKQWQLIYLEKLRAMPNRELLYELLELAPYLGDDHLTWSELGTVQWQYDQANDMLHERLGDWLEE